MVSTGNTTTTTSTQDVESVITSTASTTTTDTIASTTTIAVLTTAYVDPIATQTFRLRCEGTGNTLYDNGYYINFHDTFLASPDYTGDIFGLGVQGQLFVASNPDEIVGTFAGQSELRFYSPASGANLTPVTCSIVNDLLECQSNDGNGNVLDVPHDGSIAAGLQIQNEVASNAYAASIFVDPA